MATMPGGLPASSVARMSSTLVAAPSITGASRQVHARGAHAHLRHRLFAGDVDGAAAALRIFAQRLQDQGGFADAGIAADQQRRTRHQAAAGDAVEFGDAGDAARRRRVFGLEVFQRESAALDAPRGAAADGRRGAFLDDGVPAAAGIALPDHLGMDRAAGLADKGGGGFGHESIIARPSSELCPPAPSARAISALSGQPDACTAIRQ